MSVLYDLEPQRVFKYFEEICSIPHGSSDTKKISDFCVNFAKEHGLGYIQDEKNNVIIFKNGTAGREEKPPVIIQGHLDMVCVKDDDCEIEFKTDGLELKLNDGIISAKGTSLGGDDGIAVAYALALLESDYIEHPPLEVVLTVDEEIGMLGAAYLDCSHLNGRMMLNIDSEDEGEILAGCAGGVTAECEFECDSENVSGVLARIMVGGLLGGHSGVEIDKGRANACHVLGRILYGLRGKISYNVISVDGGMKDNAIPFSASAELVIDEKDKETFCEYIDEMNKKLVHEYVETDKGIYIKGVCGEKLQDEIKAFSKESAEKAISALFGYPCGVQKMSADIEGLVETSLNIGIVRTNDTGITVVLSVRSSVDSEKEEIVEKIKCITESTGGKMRLAGDYPAWEYIKDSPLRKIMQDVFENMYGKEPVIHAIHAGVECGIFAGKLPGLDCVSFGPDIYDIHTTSERMPADSVKRTWNYLIKVLESL